MKEITTNSLRSLYVLPSMRIIMLGQNRVICASEGQTEKYGSQSIWGAGDDNE